MTQKLLLASIFPSVFIPLAMVDYPDVRDTVITAMARALFVQAYASREEEAGRGIGPGEDWTDHAPPTTAAAWYAAEKLGNAIEKLNLIGLNTLYGACAAYYPSEHRVEPQPDDFGFYLAMQSVGSGLAWADDHPDPGLRVPRTEFHLD